MLTIHAGLPKTATTSVQKRLASGGAILAEKGIEYPVGMRDREGIAHHLLPAELLSLRSTEGPQVAELLELLRSTPGGDVVVSSEALTNLIASGHVNTLMELLSQVARLCPARLVIALRRIDDFFTSMYLHSVKVGEVTEPITQYVAARRQWSRSLFSGIAKVRQRSQLEDLVVIKYSQGGQFTKKLLTALLDDPALADSLVQEKRANERLSAKAHAVLRNLPMVSERLNSDLRRYPLVRAFERGDITFADDTHDFTLLTREQALAIHRNALNAAEAAGESQYSVFFEGDFVGNKAIVSLDADTISDDDIAMIQEYIDTTADNSVAPQRVHQ